MPKKSFKSSNSTVVIKKKKYGQITRKNLEKKCSKLLILDENNEKNWKYLKNEFGYKTDALFLEHLLNLAQKDLDFLRQKKKPNNVASDGNVESVVQNLIVKNDKHNNKAGDSPENLRVKSRTLPSQKEKEKKKMDGKVTTNKRTENEVAQNCKEESDKINLSEKTEKEENLGLKPQLVNDSKPILFQNKKSLAQNLKTDIAKDLVLENDSLGIRQKIENLDYLPAEPQFSELDVKNASQTDDHTQNEKNPDSVEKTDLKIKSQKKKTNQGNSFKLKKQKANETRQNKTKTSNAKVKPLRVAIKIKLCLFCNTRHIVGKCPAQNLLKEEDSETKLPQTTVTHENGTDWSLNLLPERNNNQPIDNNFNISSSDNFFEKECKNIYDFDENDKDGCCINSNSNWCPKMMKSREESFNENIEMQNYEINESENITDINVDNVSDSDSSNSESKLRIDESFGENISFAESSLPDYLALKILDEDHGSSIFTKIFIKKSTQFGPLIGQKMREMDIPDDFNMKDIWEINSSEGITYLCTKDAETSNWLRYLRPASSKDMANVINVVKESRLFFVTTRDVYEGEELVYWMNDIHSAWSKKKLEKKNCGGCNLQFSHPLYYRRHCMIFHDPSCSLTIRKYHCKVCGLAVLGKEKIMKHAAEMHQGKGAYQCQFCHKFFLRLNYLEMHRTYGCSKNPQRSRPLCDLCGRKFCQPQKLKVHIKRMHSDMAQVLKDFQCKSCLKILGSRAALQRHMKEVHNKDIIGACTCDRCGKMFQNKSNLKIHMLTHSGVKPFKCQQSDCTAAFTTKQCLQFHYKKVHGFADGFLPKIERSIAYTFDAYSGGVVSDPGRGQSPRFERSASPSSADTQKDCGLDLSLVLPVADASRDEKSRSNPLPPITTDCGMRRSNSNDDGDGFELVTEENVAERRSPGNDREDSIPEDELETDDLRTTKKDEAIKSDFQTDKIIVVSKGSKKWLGSNPSMEKESARFKSIFRHENSNASLLVEAAISAAEKDIIEKPTTEKELNSENLIENPNEIYIDQYMNNDSPVYETNEKKLRDYDKIPPDSTEDDSVDGSETRKSFVVNEKSNVNDILKCNALLRMNATSPLNEMPKDYNVNAIMRENEAESFADIEIHDYRNRDLLETYKENDSFHEPYRNPDIYRNDKLDLYRSNESEFRISSTDKFEYRDADTSDECYRNIASNLEKYRSADVYRLRGEGYDLAVGYREPSEEREGQVQNLCLKEKSLQYETLEELTRMGRDNPGFECLLVGDGNCQNANQNLTMPRSLHGMLSPRSYHPAAYEPESVDLSVPRPSYPSPPVYTLDLTPARIDLPTSRHVDLRSHLGLSPHRFPNARVSVVGSGSSPVSPTGYGVYPSPYATPAARPSPTSQFQPYTSLYY